MASDQFVGCICVAIVLGLIMKVPKMIPTEEEEEQQQRQQRQQQNSAINNRMNNNNNRNPYYLYGLLKELNDVCFLVINWAIDYTALAVFSMMLKVTLSTTGFDKVAYVLYVYALIYAGMLIHLFVAIPTLMCVLGGGIAYPKMLNVRQAVITALSTASSAVTLPTTIQCAVQNNRISPPVAKFVCSLGATINMDGTAIYYTIATVFMAASRGLNPTFGDLCTIGVMCTLISMGASPIPGAGSAVYFVTLLSAVNIDVENSTLFPLMIAMDWIADRPATATNILGDSMGAVVVDKIAKQNNVEIGNDLNNAADEYAERRKSLYSVNSDDDETSIYNSINDGTSNNLKESLLVNVEMT